MELSAQELQGDKIRDWTALCYWGIKGKIFAQGHAKILEQS